MKSGTSGTSRRGTLFRGVLLLSNAFLAAHGFALVPAHSSSLARVKSSLFGRKVKRGKLGTIASEEGISVRSSTPKRKTSSPPSSSNKNRSSSSQGSSSSISPGLAEWVANQQSESSSPPQDTENETDQTTDEAAVSFEPFSMEVDNTSDSSKRKSNKRREKQNARKELEEERNAKIGAIVDRLEDILEEKSGNVDDILAVVQELLQVPDSSSQSSSSGSSILRQLLAGKQRYDYRLAWVGSDDAICHVGTGLHKVPLARLQEVFMSCLGRNRLELREVIRILGPFPNVKNILQGTTKINAKNKDMEIVMDSMVDGTGKEILAGTEDNIRRVNLQIEFCDERAIVAVVPPEEGTSRSSPLEESGKHVLVFVKEDDLDEKLDALRVS